MTTINHPFEHFYGVCDWCGERSNDGGWVLCVHLGSEYIEPEIDGWRCNLCDRTIFATHQSDWTYEERAGADRMWASLGKEVAA